MKKRVLIAMCVWLAIVAIEAWRWPSLGPLPAAAAPCLERSSVVPLYPGATESRCSGARLNGFRTPDSPEHVRAFYNALSAGEPDPLATPRRVENSNEFIYYAPASCDRGQQIVRGYVLAMRRSWLGETFVTINKVHTQITHHGDC